MEDQAFKHSTTPASLSIFFLDPSIDYKYSDEGSRVAGYIFLEDVFKFFVKILQRRPSNSLFQIARGSGATLSECTFIKKCTPLRSQEAIHGFSQESTQKKLVSTWQDLEEQEETSKINHTMLGGLSVHSAWGTLQEREKI
jgi:hypothetical protein